MTLPPITAERSTPQLLPLRRPGSTGFGEALRAQVRAEAAQAARAQLHSAADGAAGTGRAAALQQSLLGRRRQPADSAGWGAVAKDIGRQYLSPQVADLFSRQMALESGNFDPDVIAGRRVSSAGAEGIAQLMPSSYPRVNRLDPVASLHAAAATMRANLQQYGGDVRKALAAYNAGVGTVDAAVRRRGAAWEADLPEETTTYLRELLGVGHG